MILELYWDWDQLNWRRDRVIINDCCYCGYNKTEKQLLSVFKADLLIYFLLPELLLEYSIGDLETRIFQTSVVFLLVYFYCKSREAKTYEGRGPQIQSK